MTRKTNPIKPTDSEAVTLTKILVQNANSLKELAKEMKVSANAISHWINNHREPSTESQLRIEELARQKGFL